MIVTSLTADKYQFKAIIATDSIMIPPILLQPFVENAILNWLMQKEDEGSITVEIKKENEEFLNISITNQIHNTSCNRSRKDKDYPYYMQQCEMYRQIIKQLVADLHKFTQKKRTGEFCIELEKDKQDVIHKCSPIRKSGTSTVF